MNFRSPVLPTPAAFCLALAAGLTAVGPASALDCRRQAQEEMRELGVTADDIASVRYVEKYNPTEQGPDVLGVRAWVRLKACASGYLVVDMTRSCFVRQSYTRGECRREGITAY
jgi:hypothetical protein